MSDFLHKLVSASCHQGLFHYEAPKWWLQQANVLFLLSFYLINIFYKTF